MPTNNIRSLVFTALFAALFVVMSSLTIKLGGSFVPFTLQTLAVALTGLFLTPRNAFLSIAAVIVLAAFGLPLFSGQGGIATLTGHTAGFIFAFPFCAMLISLAVGAYLKKEGTKRSKTAALVAFFLIFELFSSLCAYVPGIPWLMHVTGLPLGKALAAGCYPFLIGDAVKSLAAALLAVSMLPYVIHIRTSTVKARPDGAAYEA
ncbi:biotin transporter BioY [Paenibacillus arenilitoris]|uniref:Biotin transporter n=1 Tax=Paenibacillus arenilitoris TaxID=2772299 RepID=A0A927CPX9_9BACL|nr:biotin transporter BioY [Paenibacillus arenilitoris]MBD2870653.1 biotin transporter BioY [Paenibacillus arenilitoris]